MAFFVEASSIEDKVAEPTCSSQPACQSRSDRVGHKYLEDKNKSNPQSKYVATATANSQHEGRQQIKKLKTEYMNH